MTTHFSNGVTNNPGRDKGGNPLWSVLKQPDPTSALTEFVYFDDFFKYVPADWTITDEGGSETQTADYDNGWLSQVDTAPAANAVNLLEGPDVWSFQKGDSTTPGLILSYETQFAIKDVDKLNTWHGLAIATYADPIAVPLDGVGFHHAEDTTTIQFSVKSSTVGGATSETLVTAPGGSTNITLADAAITTKSATAPSTPDEVIRLGFMYVPAGRDSYHDGATAGKFWVFYNGVRVATVADTNLPYDKMLGVSLGWQSKATDTNALYTDFIKIKSERMGVSAPSWS
mgnify:FL=1